MTKEDFRAKVALILCKYNIENNIKIEHHQEGEIFTYAQNLSELYESECLFFDKKNKESSMKKLDQTITKEDNGKDSYVYREYLESLSDAKEEQAKEDYQDNIIQSTNKLSKILLIIIILGSIVIFVSLLEYFYFKNDYTMVGILCNICLIYFTLAFIKSKKIINAISSFIVEYFFELKKNGSVPRMETPPPPPKKDDYYINNVSKFLCKYVMCTYVVVDCVNFNHRLGKWSNKDICTGLFYINHWGKFCDHDDLEPVEDILVLSFKESIEGIEKYI